MPAGWTQEIVAQPLVIPAHGQIDLRVSIDTSNLAVGWIFGPGLQPVRVKGTFTSWWEVDAVDDGTAGDLVANDGVYTMVLSSNVGPGNLLPHLGLLQAGIDAEFVIVFGGVEYRGTVVGWPSPVGLADGVSAELMPPGGVWSATPILRTTPMR